MQEFSKATLDKMTKLTIRGDVTVRSEYSKQSTADVLIVLSNGCEFEVGDKAALPVEAYFITTPVRNVELATNMLNLGGLVIGWERPQGDSLKHVFTLVDVEGNTKEVS